MAQKVQPRQVPKLNAPLCFPAKFDGTVSPYDSIFLDAARGKQWLSYRKNLSRRSQNSKAMSLPSKGVEAAEPERTSVV